MAVQDLALAPSFRVGEVLSKTFSIWFSNIVPFGLLGLLFNIPLAIAGYFFFEILVASAGQIAPGELPPGFIWRAIVAVLVVMAFYQLLTASITYGVIMRLRGQPIALGPCLGQGIKRFLPVIFTGLLGTILAAIGGIFLVIPGIIVLVGLWVAVPVCVVEELGVGASLERAWALSKGYRWKLLGVILVMGIILGVVQQVIQLLANSFVGGGSVGLAALAPALGILMINQAISVTLTAVTVTCAYYYLRVAKEGVDIDQIASVFD